MPITLADSEREIEWRKEVREFINDNEGIFANAAADEGGEGSMFGRLGAHQGMARQGGREGLDRAGLAEGVRRRRHDGHASSSSSTRSWR